MLYTVRYTTKSIVTKYDGRGNKVGTYTDDVPVVITALPHITAMQYKDCDNFKIEPYFADPGRGEPAPRRTHAESSGRERTRAPTTKPAGKPSVNDAARTGDLAAAINGGA
ncbi:hypothetical protein [Ancylobacter rudongensis]|uniref:Uncharacterized protein n=1 Tax=Ancylobacter rudongensis TaxID=177413 RepID=A0A1G4UQB8_9HYPH|nr:hypothetical protein [Ancylobacter rudongensis]SCW95820.1 hypothetical protein SAMN05660859_0126 [Ancylobacter rudongensis]